MQLERTSVPHPTAAENTRLAPSGPQLVACYSAAKSRQDVAAALALCHDDFVLDTVAFGIRGAGKEIVAGQLRIFFTTFPDYGVSTDGVAEAEGVVTTWGTVGR